MSNPSSGSLFNLVWLVLFAGCVVGLVMWGMDATSHPTPVAAQGASTAQGFAALPAAAAPGAINLGPPPATMVPQPLVAANDATTATDTQSLAGHGPTVHGPAIHARKSATGAVLPTSATTSPAAATPAGLPEMVRLPGGTFRMGNDQSAFHSEKPAHEATVRPFWMDQHEVTLDAFAKFVEATGYKTAAERQGWAPVFNPKTDLWESLPGADFRRPRGSEGRPAEGTHPVTQVSWEDATAYARWAGKRLPTEAEWEYAARGGLVGASFPWGNDLMPAGKYVSNFWQGPYPTHNTKADGFAGPAPVGSYPPNAYGLYDMSGNVWEWCSDWFSQSYYTKSAHDYPAGPVTGTERVQRGGSWFCSPDAKPGYMVYSRMSAPPTTMYPHVGFRCARDAE